MESGVVVGFSLPLQSYLGAPPTKGITLPSSRVIRPPNFGATGGGSATVGIELVGVAPMVAPKGVLGTCGVEYVGTGGGGLGNLTGAAAPAVTPTVEVDSSSPTSVTSTILSS